MLINKKSFFTKSHWIVFNRRKADRRARPQGRSFMANLRKATVVTVVLTSALATCLASVALAESVKEYRYTVGRNANISVDTQYGAISVRPGSGNQVVVTATLSSNKVEVD